MKRILAVDDSASMRQMVSFTLKTAGFDVTEAKELRGLPDYKFTPLLMLTTESGMDKKVEGKAAGATGWIVKPFNPDQLLAVLKKVIR